MGSSHSVIKRQAERRNSEHMALVKEASVLGSALIERLITDQSRGEKETVACLALNRTSISLSLRIREHREWRRKNIRAGGMYGGRRGVP